MSSVDSLGLQKVLQSLEERITATKSLQSNPDGIFSMRARVGKSWNTLAQLLICSFCEPWETDFFIRAVSQKCYQCQYEGEWNLVQEILEHYPKSPSDFVEIFLKYHTPEEFFGNLIGLAQKELRLVKWINPSLSPSRNVRKRVRRRGYRDHGTLRPIHQRHGDPPEPKSKIDRRKQIKHPLLSETIEEEELIP